MNGQQHAIVKALVRNVLQNASRFDWTVQGLGMLRTYLSKEIRLHVWNSALRTPGVSTLHTHPWDFSSLIVAGVVHNVRFEPNPRSGRLLVHSQRLACGIGGGLVGEPEDHALSARPIEVYREGQTYRQAAHEIHESRPVDGTVTLITRTFHEDEDHALVFWLRGTQWKTAEPSRAAGNEVVHVVSHALDTWFKEPRAPIPADHARHE